MRDETEVLTIQEVGRRGGSARARKLTPEQRRESARCAARARWAKKKGGGGPEGGGSPDGPGGGDGRVPLATFAGPTADILSTRRRQPKPVRVRTAKAAA